MGHAKKLTQKPVWSRTPTLRTYEQQVGASRGYTKPRRLSGCLVTVVGRKLLRGCRCVGYQIEARLPEATLGKATAAQAHAWEDSKGTRDSVEASLKLPGDASYRGAPVANIRLQTEPSTKEMPLASSKRSPNPVKPARAGLAPLRRGRLPVVCRTNGSLSDRLPPSRMGYSSGSLE